MKKFIFTALIAFASVSAHASRFVVQIGTFDEQQSAQAWVPVLQKVGVQAYTEQRGDRTLLRAGPFADRDEAVAALQKVRDAGLGGTADAMSSVPPEPPATVHILVPAPVTTATEATAGGDWMAYDTSRRACVRIKDQFAVSNPDEYAAMMSHDGRPGTIAKYLNNVSAVIYVPALGDHQPTTLLGKGVGGCTKIMQIANMFQQ